MLWLLCSAAFGSDLMLSADTMGVGQAATANHSSQASILANPSTMGLVSRYDFGALGGISGTRQGHWGVSGVDSQSTEQIALGFAYTGDLAQPPLTVFDLPPWTDQTDIRNRKRYHDLSLAIAVPVLKRRLSFGVTGNLQLYNHDRQGKGETGNLHAGVATRPVDWLVIGVVGRNLLPINGQEDRPATVNSGVRVYDDDIGAFSVDVDVQTEDLNTIDVANPSRVSVATGGEVNISASRVRVGWRYAGPMDQHHLYWGLGIADRGVTLGYSQQIPVVPNLRVGDLIHVLSATITGPSKSSFQPQTDF